MDWIVMDNLPFWVVESERFCRLVKSVNPMAWIPIRRTIINLVTREYQQATPHIKALLQTAKGLIHLTFDGWTSRQNDPYLGINAYFVDRDWKQHTVLLGLQTLQGTHTGANIAEEVTVVLKFFEVENR
jgi:hypothetical protein